MNLLPGSEALASWHVYLETAQRVILALDEGLKKNGSDLGEYNILMVLAEAPGRTLKVSEIGARIVFSLPRLTYRISSLANAGLVVTRQCPHDKRARLVTLTEDGLARFLSLGKAHQGDIASLTSTLTNRQLGTLADLSQRIQL